MRAWSSKIQRHHFAKKTVDPDTVSEPKAKVHIYEKSGAGAFLVVFGCYLISDANRWSQMLPSKIRDNIKYPASPGLGNSWSELLIMIVQQQGKKAMSRDWAPLPPPIQKMSTERWHVFMIGLSLSGDAHIQESSEPHFHPKKICDIF